MLKQRIISAIILIPVFIAFLFFLPPLAFGIFTALITLLAAWEWSNLIGIKTISKRLFYVLLMVFFLFLILFVHVIFIFFFSCLCWLCAFVMIVLYPRGRNWWSKPIFWRAVMGFLVLIPCWTAINYIRNQTDGIYALLFLFVLIWGADSFAYGVGKKWGKNKLAPMVSPGKSIQGLLGALVFAVIGTLFAEWLGQVPRHIWLWGILVSVITVLFSVVGDLFESMLKREAHIKDSGQLIPGHGGLLDRIDSLTAAAPIFALGAILLSMYLQ